jgi:hypothetical protein
MIKEIDKTSELLDLSYIIITQSISIVYQHYNPLLQLIEETHNIYEKFVSLVDQKSVKTPVKIKFTTYEDLQTKLTSKFKNCYSQENYTLYYLSFSNLSSYNINIVKDEYDFQNMISQNFERLYIEKTSTDTQIQSLLLNKQEPIISISFVYNNSRLSYPTNTVSEKQSALLDEVISSFEITNSDLILFFNLERKTFTLQELIQFLETEEACVKSQTFYIR